MQDDSIIGEYKRVIEAALFTSGRAMGADEIAKVLGMGSMGAVGKIMGALTEEYEKRDSAIEIVQLGGKYAMMLKEKYAAKVGQLSGQPDISKGAMKILAYVSKNQPVMQNGIVKAFGDSTYAHIKELVEKEFITTRKAGRTKKIETTSKFLEYFELKGQDNKGS